jgi:7-cyano-7-deazaguanine reductase
MAYEEKRKLQCITHALREQANEYSQAHHFRCVGPAIGTTCSTQFSGLVIGLQQVITRQRPGTTTRGTEYNSGMPKSPRSVPSRPKSPRSTSPRYTDEHAGAGLDYDFPEIEAWPNQFPGYEIVVDDPEFTSVCPKTSLPDFGNIVIRYEPDRWCLELKSLKEYLQSYRNLGIFQENIVNQVLEDVVRWAKPVWAEVKGEFRPRGGISTVVIAKWPRMRNQK